MAGIFSLIPASMRMAPYLMSSSLISYASPHAEMIMSACCVILLMSVVKISQVVTVALKGYD